MVGSATAVPDPGQSVCAFVAVFLQSSSWLSMDAARLLALSGEHTSESAFTVARKSPQSGRARSISAYTMPLMSMHVHPG